MEVRFYAFPLLCVNKEFSIQFLIISKRIFPVARYRACPKKKSMLSRNASKVPIGGKLTVTIDGDPHDLNITQLVIKGLRSLSLSLSLSLHYS